MNFLHYDLDLEPDEAVQVELDEKANVRLLDDLNFAKYKRGERHSYFGGLAKESPVQLTPPHGGHWNLVIDLGGYPGRVKASVSTLKPQHA